jgi:uncharacterized membrane protein
MARGAVRSHDVPPGEPPAEASPLRGRHGVGQRHDLNVGRRERWLSAGAGTALVLFGLRRRGLERAVLELAGMVLAYRGISGHCPLYRAVGADTSGRDRPDMASLTREQGIKLERSVTVARPAAELYRFWRAFENLPRVIPSLRSVTPAGAERSRWVTRTAGRTIEWEAEVVADREGELIAWRSIGGGDLDHGGSVAFKSLPGDRGTTVKVTMNYRPPAGKPGALIGRLLGASPDVEFREGLRRFKQLMEAGEVATTAGQPVGRKSERDA